jgi:hypothetical protein
VFNVRLDQFVYGGVTGILANPYHGTMSMYDVTGYYVVFDRHGNVIGGANEGSGGLTLLADGAESLRPGQTTRIVIGFPTNVRPARMALVRVSVDPGFLPKGGRPIGGTARQQTCLIRVFMRAHATQAEKDAVQAAMMKDQRMRNVRYISKSSALFVATPKVPADADTVARTLSIRPGVNGVATGFCY